jgi:hypothetical protein
VSSAEHQRRRRRLHAGQGHPRGHHAQGLQGGLRQFVEGGWPALSCDPSTAARACPSCSTSACTRCSTAPTRPGPCTRPVARRLRGPARARHRRAEEAVPAQADQRRVDRHHVPDRAALRHRPGPAAHQGRAAGRRQLQDHRQQDLHQRRRARHGRQHRAPGAGAPARCAQGTRASACSSCPSSR